MAFTLSVKQPTVVSADTTGYIVEVEVTAAHSDMPTQVFVWYKALGLTTTVPTDAFAAVCSLEQLASLPTTPAEAEEMQIPFYRTSIARVVVRSLDEGTSFVDTLKADLYRLKRDYDASKTLIARTDTV